MPKGGGLRRAQICEGTSGSVWLSRLRLHPPGPAQQRIELKWARRKSSMSKMEDISVAAHAGSSTLPADTLSYGLPAPCSSYQAAMRHAPRNATPQCTAHKGRLLGLGLAASSSADVLASWCFWASSCMTSCIRSICRPQRMFGARGAWSNLASARVSWLHVPDSAWWQHSSSQREAELSLSCHPWQESIQRHETHLPVRPHAGAVV